MTLNIPVNKILEYDGDKEIFFMSILDEIIKQDKVELFNHITIRTRTNIEEQIMIMIARHGSYNCLKNINDEVLIRYLNDNLILTLIGQSGNKNCIMFAYEKVNRFPPFHTIQRNKELINEFAQILNTSTYNEQFSIVEAPYKCIFATIKLGIKCNMFDVAYDIGANCNIKTIELFNYKTDKTFSTALLFGAAVGGNIEYVKKYSHNIVNNDYLCVNVAGNGFIDCLKLIYKEPKKHIILNFAVAASIAIDSVECLKFLYEKGAQLYSHLGDTAAKYRSIKCLKFLVENSEEIKKNIMGEATQLTDNSYNYAIAAYNLNLNYSYMVGDFDLSKEQIANLNENNYSKYLLQFGTCSIDTLRALYDAGCPWTDNFFKHIIKTLKKKPMALTLRNQYYECFKFAYERGCYISPSQKRIAQNMGLI